MQRADALPRPLPRKIGEGAPVEATLLDLVRAVAEQTADEAEVVAVVLRLLRSGRVRLIGSFRGQVF